MQKDILKKGHKIPLKLEKKPEKESRYNHLKEEEKGKIFILKDKLRIFICLK